MALAVGAVAVGAQAGVALTLALVRLLTQMRLVAEGLIQQVGVMEGVVGKRVGLMEGVVGLVDAERQAGVAEG